MLNQLVKDYSDEIEQQNIDLTINQTVNNLNNVAKGELIGNHLLQTIIMKIVYFTFNRGILQYRNVINNIYKQLQLLLKKNSAIIKRVLWKMYQNRKIVFINQVEKQLQQFIKQKQLLDKKDFLDSFKQPEILAKKIIQTKNDPITERINQYINSDVFHPKSQLTEFCHQMKIPQPVYEREAQDKYFKVTCKLKIPEQKTQFKSLYYEQYSKNTNIKSAATEAAKKLLGKIYIQNFKQWQKFKEIKKKKKL